MTDFRTPLSKVRGHGAAREGVHEFIAHRVSAIILALVFPIFCLWPYESPCQMDMTD